MENKRVTAVEWLVEELMKTNLKISIDGLAALSIQALEMEKEQIKDAFVNYFYNEDLLLNDKIALHKIAEQYYNETYGK